MATTLKNCITLQALLALALLGNAVQLMFCLNKFALADHSSCSPAWGLHCMLCFWFAIVIVNAHAQLVCPASTMMHKAGINIAISHMAVPAQGLLCQRLPGLLLRSIVYEPATV